MLLSRIPWPPTGDPGAHPAGRSAAAEGRGGRAGGGLTNPLRPWGFLCHPVHSSSHRHHVPGSLLGVEVGETTAPGSLARAEAAPIAQSCRRCCWEHDCCYKKLKYHGCGTKFLGYNVSIRRGQIICGKNKSYRLHPASFVHFPVCLLCRAPELDTKGQVSASRAHG